MSPVGEDVDIARRDQRELGQEQLLFHRAETDLEQKHGAVDRDQRPRDEGGYRGWSAFRIGNCEPFASFPRIRYLAWFLPGLRG